MASYVASSWCSVLIWPSLTVSQTLFYGTSYLFDTWSFLVMFSSLF